MEIDMNMIKKLQNTDDATLKELIKNIAKASGASDRQINNAVRNVATVKKQMSRMSDSEVKRQINKQVQKIGEDKAEEILKQLKL